MSSFCQVFRRTHPHISTLIKNCADTRKLLKKNYIVCPANILSAIPSPRYIYGIGNLTNLLKIGSSRDIINYIHLLTAVLNRLSLKQESSADLLTLTRSVLISSVCQLTSTDQVTVLTECLRFTKNNKMI